MRRIRMKFDGAVIHAVLRDTPTAEVIWNALPIRSEAFTWGDEVYFTVPVDAPREDDAQALVEAGEIAYWPDGAAIAVSYGETPISTQGEIRLASPCNIWADAEEDVRLLKTVPPGTRVVCERV